jgi:hypothetical protein
MGSIPAAWRASNRESVNGELAIKPAADQTFNKSMNFLTLPSNGS